MANFGEPVREVKPPPSTAVKLQFLMKDVLKASQASSISNLEIIPGNKFFQEISPRTLDEIPTSMQKDIKGVGQYLINAGGVIKENVLKEAIRITGAKDVSEISYENIGKMTKEQKINFLIELNKAQGAISTGASMIILENITISNEQKQTILHEVADVINITKYLNQEILSERMLVENGDVVSADYQVNKEQITSLAEQALGELLKTADFTHNYMNYESSLVLDTTTLIKYSDSKLFSPGNITSMERLAKLYPLVKFTEENPFRLIVKKTINEARQ